MPNETSQTRDAPFAGMPVLSWSRAATCIALAAILLGCAQRAMPEDSQWPPLARGRYDVSTTKTLPGGRTTSVNSTKSNCAQPSFFWMAYHGPGVVDKAGCRYTSRKAESGYLVKSECHVRGTGMVTTELTVTLTGDREFHAVGEVKDTGVRVSQTGQRVGDCPRSQ